MSDQPIPDRSEDDERALPRAGISIWMSPRGERQWSLRIREGIDPDELDRLIQLALDAEERIRRGNR